MDILFLLVPLGVVLAFAIGAAFWLAVDGGQFDDLEGPGLAVVLDDDAPGPARSVRAGPIGFRGGIEKRVLHSTNPLDQKSDPLD